MANLFHTQDASRTVDELLEFFSSSKLAAQPLIALFQRNHLGVSTYGIAAAGVQTVMQSICLHPEDVLC